jgi:ElaB/YqjD/DUF883 family membrane-anchored ribosome-binding protein
MPKAAVQNLRDQGREAVKAAGDVRERMTDAIDKSVQDRPYTTLLLAVGLGFLVGTIWGR